MHFARRSLLTMLLIGMLLTACGGQPAATEPAVDINATIAAGAETLAAALFQTQTAMAPTITNTSPPTVTSLPTNTALALPSPVIPVATATQGFIFVASPTPTGTFYTSTPLATSLAVGCNNLRLIRAYTDPAGPFLPGQNFTQYWQVENNGRCDWVYLYHLVHGSGNRMGGEPGRLGKVIEPGKWTTLSVGLTAPNSDGTHTAAWRFSDQGGTGFGASLPVSITVKRNPDPTNTPVPPTAPPNLAQTADALNTAIAGATNVAGTATANYCQTAIAAGTPPPCP